MGSLENTPWFLSGKENLDQVEQSQASSQNVGSVRSKKKYPTSLSGDTLLVNGSFGGSNNDLSSALTPEPEMDFNLNSDDVNNIDWSHLCLAPMFENSAPQQQQSRVPSGTAIFGFPKHDRVLQLPKSVVSEAPLLNDSKKGHLESSDRERQLELALAQQYEANRRLQNQLDKSKMKNQLDFVQLEAPKDIPDSNVHGKINDMNLLPQDLGLDSNYLNGSPVKKSSITKQPISTFNQGNDMFIPNVRKASRTIREMENYFQELNKTTEANSHQRQGLLGVPHKADPNITTYGNQMISPALSNNFSPAMNNLMSLTSSNSELQPDLFDYNSNNSSYSLGLGFHSDKRSSVSIMPTIPMSAEASPSKPVSIYPTDLEEELEFSEQVPISISSSNYDLTSSQEPMSLLGTESKNDFEIDSQLSEFNDYLSEKSELSSPSKITKKPTTLPRGSIDIYVKQLPDKQFECLYQNCGKQFKRRYNIRSHIQTHLADRPYKCDFQDCDKNFVRNHDLIRHKKCHFEKTHVCPCGKKFYREDALIVHRSRMICPGGKKYENIVIKRSPRKRGRPRKNAPDSVASSPVKESVENDQTGYVLKQIEQQVSAPDVLFRNPVPNFNLSDDNDQFSTSLDNKFIGLPMQQGSSPNFNSDFLNENSS